MCERFCDLFKAAIDNCQCDEGVDKKSNHCESAMRASDVESNTDRERPHRRQGNQ